MQEAIVLCYNLSPERTQQVSGLAKSADITPRIVEKTEYHQPIGALCGMMPMEENLYEGEGFEEEMLLMAFLEKGMLTKFLDSFRDTGTASIPLKAMLTETNSKWDSVALYTELREEYEYFRRMQENQA